MSNRKPPRKHVGSAFEASIKTGLKKRKNQVRSKVIFEYKYKPLHQRQFFHSQSKRSFALGENSVITDSEDEYQSLDMERHQKIINGHRYLSDGQKNIMNLWNGFVGKCNKFGIKKVKFVCESFVDLYIDEIRDKKLYPDFLMHLCTLNSANLLKQKDFHAVIQHLHKHMGIQRKGSASMVSQKNHQKGIPKGKENKVNGKRRRSRSPMDIELESIEKRATLRSHNSTDK